ncbi:hypothetical protein SK128_001969 [Halocaridina rubra]|uniref:C2 domain-containing protein n=1 Tax=Halocaridina rubra TaxID=373956 RepID=A0AAN9AC65_HALRR
MSPEMLGGLIVGIFIAVAAVICIGLCLALWYKRIKGQAGDPSPATFLVSKRKPGQYASPEHPMAFVMPTITASDAGSEPQTPTPTVILTPTERSKAIAKIGASPQSQSRANAANPEDHPNVQRWDALVTSSSTPPPAYSPPPPLGRHQFSPAGYGYGPFYSNLRPRSASPKGPHKSSQRHPPLSLPLAASRWVPRTNQRPRSASPKVLETSPGTPPAVPPRAYQALSSRTPPVLPPRSIFFRRIAGGTEDVRSSSQAFLVDEGGNRTSPDFTDVTTPDSMDGWGNSWTNASSIGSGGGCGLGELQVRLRYSMKTRLLRLTVLSADNLPLRLGPEPVDTYTKAVLLPDKRVRFSTRTIPALRNAHFNASFTHAARPSRLANATLRFSVCQVTACGRRVVLGYVSLPLASTGLRAGLNHDLDTGALILHLQESAPDQQVGMGGHLQIGLSWDSDASELTISILHLTGLQYDQNTISKAVQVYIKVTVYTNNTILCWRRTTPRTVEAEVTLFEEELILRMPELDLDATHLVLSARERTGPGCGRRVLGSCVVGRGGCVSEDGRHHWLDMLRAAPDIVVRTHPLASLAPFHSLANQDILPTYQNVFPGPSARDPDLPVYHRYENVGLICGKPCSLTEISGPKEIQGRDVTLQNQCEDQDVPSSSDECQSSELPTPDQCLSPELHTDECQDIEESSHHSDFISSDQSHYSEISSPDQFHHQELSSQDLSSEDLTQLQQSNTRLSFTAMQVEVPESSLKEKNQETPEKTYSNPMPHKVKYDTPRVPSEPIYAKPDLMLKRLARQNSLDLISNASTSSHIYQSLDHPNSPIYEKPDLLSHSDSLQKHIYDKPENFTEHLYENSALLTENIYQVPDLSVPHLYQNPNISSQDYESPDQCRDHVYQNPYDCGLRRYENSDVIMEAIKNEHQNSQSSIGRPLNQHRYVNVPKEPIGACPPSPDVKAESSEKCVESQEEKTDESEQCKQSVPPMLSCQTPLQDTESESSGVYHDARSSTHSE